MTIKLFTDFISGDVLRNADGRDCTNGGASSKFEQLYVVARHVELQDVIQLCEENKHYRIEQFFKLDYEFHATNRGYCRLKPVYSLGKWYMFGGNYLKSSDSRFKEFVGGCLYPIPILDRTEY